MNKESGRLSVTKVIETDRLCSLEKIANTFLGQSMADPSMFTVEEQIELFWMDYR